MISPAGRVGLKTTSPKAQLDVVGTMSGTTAVFSTVPAEGSSQNTLCITATGIVQQNASTTCLVSSKRFKHAIESLTGSLEKVLAMRPVSYRNNNDNELNIGLIAEEVEKIDPRLVFYERDGKTVRGVKYEQTVAELIGAIQELEKQNKSLDARLQKLESQ